MAKFQSDTVKDLPTYKQEIYSVYMDYFGVSDCGILANTIIGDKLKTNLIIGMEFVVCFPEFGIYSIANTR